MSDQAELDRIILQLLGKDELVGSKEQIIIYNQEQDIVKMDLSDLALTSLPDGLFDNFTELRELNLSYNTFEKLPIEIFKNLTQLKILDLSYSINPAEFSGEEDKVTFPETIFDSLKDLQYLNPAGNQLELLPDKIFAQLYNLERLDLSYNLLAVLPASIGALVNLDHLLLESNFLPVEFQSEYEGYLEVQDFLSPFQQEWMAVHQQPVEEHVEEKDKHIMEDELRKAFNMLGELFD